MCILGCLAEEIKEKCNTEEEGYRVRKLFFTKVDKYRHYVHAENMKKSTDIHSETIVKIISEDKHFQTQQGKAKVWLVTLSLPLILMHCYFLLD